MKKLTIYTLCILMLLSLSAYAQDADPEKIVLELTDPSSPAIIDVDWNVEGDVKIEGYDGTTVEIEFVNKIDSNSDRTIIDNLDVDVDVNDRNISRRRSSKRSRTGLRRLNVSSGRMTAHENDNIVTIRHGYSGGSANVNIKVPRNSSIEVHTMDDGSIYVNSINGVIEANNLNGDLIELVNISGTVLANCLNGDIFVSMTSVDPENPMSFQAMNGDIEVEFPQDLKASINLRCGHGEVYTDFETLELKNTLKREEYDTGAGYTKLSEGILNGGGMEIKFYTMNGDIIIRKKQ